jgi:hypothetical protein
MTETSSAMWPVLARWRQQSDGGTVTWHLAGLRADRGFWGYVHFRTDTLQENRSFEGTLDEPTFERASKLIREIERHSENDSNPKVLDGMVGIGRRSSFRRIFGIRDGIAEPNVPSVINAYGELLRLLQPILTANIIS